MQSIQSIKREVTLGIALTALVFLCAIAWGSPFISARSGAAPVQAQSAQAQSVTLTGTIVRDGEQFMLREAGGQIFRLDDPQHAQSFEGKAVKVTGKLDTEAKLIHVERIESAAV